MGCPSTTTGGIRTWTNSTRRREYADRVAVGSVPAPPFGLADRSERCRA